MIDLDYKVAKMFGEHGWLDIHHIALFSRTRKRVAHH
jgi:hypothetical protein